MPAINESSSPSPIGLAELLRDIVLEGLDRRRWSRHRLAQAVGLSPKHVSQLLNGRTAGSIDAWNRMIKAVAATLE